MYVAPLPASYLNSFYHEKEGENIEGGLCEKRGWQTFVSQCCLVQKKKNIGEYGSKQVAFFAIRVTFLRIIFMPDLN